MGCYLKTNEFHWNVFCCQGTCAFVLICIWIKSVFMQQNCLQIKLVCQNWLLSDNGSRFNRSLNKRNAQNQNKGWQNRKLTALRNLVNPIQLSRRVLMLSLQCGWWGRVLVGGRLQTASDSQTLFVATTLGAILFVTPRRKSVVEFTQRGYPITLFSSLRLGTSPTVVLGRILHLL